MFIAADIGGTNARFGLFEPTSDGPRMARAATLPTADASDPGDLLEEFAGGDAYDAACLAVAGAVVDGLAYGSNLPWDVDAVAMSEGAGVPVTLINDLTAIATFVPHAAPDQLVVLQKGQPVKGGPIGVIAPGTGMGQGLLFTDDDGSYRAQPSEAGHLDFAPNDRRQDAWLMHLRARHGHVSLERACSGGSIPRLYAFLSNYLDVEADPRVAAQAAKPDAAAAITAAALEDRCPVASATLEMFVEILGAAAGDLALQIVATGGIVLAGGIPPRILPALRREGFLRAFCHKGRFAHLTERTPVSVLTESDAGLYGAAIAHLS
jgi:glucokinase